MSTRKWGSSITCALQEPSLHTLPHLGPWAGLGGLRREALYCTIPLPETGSRLWGWGPGSLHSQSPLALIQVRHPLRPLPNYCPLLLSSILQASFSKAPACFLAGGLPQAPLIISSR